MFTGRKTRLSLAFMFRIKAIVMFCRCKAILLKANWLELEPAQPQGCSRKSLYALLWVLQELAVNLANISKLVLFCSIYV